MYAAAPEWDLRQGDVLAGLHYYCLKSSPFPTNRPFDSIRTERKEYPIVILSNSCDVTSENATKPKRFTFSPLQGINEGRFRRQFHRLDEPQEINQKRADGTFGYVRFFFFEPHPDIPGDSGFGYLLDFSLLRQGNRNNGLFIPHKVAELDDEASGIFAEKLMAFFGREQPPTQV